MFAFLSWTGEGMELSQRADQTASSSGNSNEHAELRCGRGDSVHLRSYESSESHTYHYSTESDTKSKSNKYIQQQLLKQFKLDLNREYVIDILSDGGQFQCYRWFGEINRRWRKRLGIGELDEHTSKQNSKQW